MADEKDDLEMVRSSGNIFADFGAPNASLRQFRAVLAAEIVKMLDTERLTVRDAGACTGIGAADFCRIRQAKLDRFTIDRLMRVLDWLNRDVRVEIFLARKSAWRVMAKGHLAARPLPVDTTKASHFAPASKCDQTATMPSWLPTILILQYRPTSFFQKANGPFRPHHD